ncbi:MAG: peptide-methionine (S)-S-oxide reductase, partial [Pseudomonadota bacterium]
MLITQSRFAAVLAGLLLGVALAATAAEPTAKTQPTTTAVFAGGCFWCMEPPFDKLPGVVATTSGYTGGQKINPTYQEVSA